VTQGEKSVSAETKEKKGCWKGCLITLAVLAILAAAGLGAGIYYGFQWAGERLAELKTEHPWLEPAWKVLTDLAAPVGETDQAALLQGRQEGSPDRALLPADMAVFSESLREAFSIGEKQITVFQQIDRPVKEVQRHFDREWKRNGWKPGPDLNPLGPGSTWTKGEWTCRISFFDAPAPTEIFIRCSRAAGE